MPMRMMRNLVALCLALMMLCAPALAEAPFLMHTKGWTLESTPLSVKLTADVTSLIPYDDDRFAMLKVITDKLSLRISTDGDAGSVTIGVAMTDALTLAYRGEAVQISTIPEMTFTSSENVMDKLLGESTTGFSLYGLRGDAETLLDDGEALLLSLLPEIEAYGKRKNVKTNISDMGMARSCTDYTVPKDDVEQLKETLLSLCADGWLREIIAGLTFSGKQTLRVYCTEDEVPLRMEYNGTCGPEGNLRTVKLVWRMRRDDVARRDEVTLTSPAKTGSNKNTLEFERVISTDKSGTISMKGSFSYTVTADRLTTTRKGEFDLNNACTEEADVVSGDLTLPQKLPGEDSFAGVTIIPQVTLGGTAESPAIAGTVEVSTLNGKNVLDHATIRMTVQRGEGIRWVETEETLDMDVLTNEELAVLQQDVASGVASAIVRPLILLMGGEADWFFRDMPEESVDRIVDAVDNVVIFEYP